MCVYKREICIHLIFISWSSPIFNTKRTVKALFMAFKKQVLKWRPVKNIRELKRAPFQHTDGNQKWAVFRFNFLH